MHQSHLFQAFIWILNDSIGFNDIEWRVVWSLSTWVAAGASWVTLTWQLSKTLIEITEIKVMAHRRSRNKVFMLGNSTVDFEFLGSGNSAVAFSIATNEVWRDRNTGQMQEKTEFHRCIAFGKTAEYLVNYGRKGSLIDLEGKLQHRKWQDQGGNDRITTEIVVSEAQIIDGWKNEDNQSTNNQQQNTGHTPAPQAQGQGYSQPVPAQSYPAMDMPTPEYADDVPEFHQQ